MTLALPAIAADLDEALLRDAVRYGSTPAKRERKAAARAELMDRGADGLRLVMRHAHVENIGLQVLAFERVESLDNREAAPVLAEFLHSEHERTRQAAAWLLGFCQTPEHAAAIQELLADEKACGAAIRALGKWKVRAAATAIEPYVRHEKEPRRVVAINALRDIGDPASVPALLEALNDPFFTVREAAARALSVMGAPAERALLRALPGAEDPARRLIIRTLGVMRSRRAAGALRVMLKDADPRVRADAEEALKSVRVSRKRPAIRARRLFH